MRRRIALLTREYPPYIYGGAGVHVEHLAIELRRLVDLRVHCFGDNRGEPNVHAYGSWDALSGSAPYLGALRTMATDLTMAAALAGVELVHSHTWYANLAGHLAKLLFGVPHVMTTHSLEPLRPWKAEQLEGGYAVSSFCERTAISAADAVIAVSRGMRNDILSTYPNVDPARVVVIHNGIDAEVYKPDTDTSLIDALGIDKTRPYVAFVGRITRQKGVVHLLAAADKLVGDAQLVLCAGEPDTPELAAEVRQRVRALPAGRVVWIEKMLSRPEVVQVLSHARAFACPSVYEPFGIVNLEAMACGVPVVASHVGGIPEIVVDGDTGILVPFSPTASALGPKDPERFAADFAAALNRYLRDATTAKRAGAAGRARVLAEFTWQAIGTRTLSLYEQILKRGYTQSS